MRLLLLIIACHVCFTSMVSAQLPEQGSIGLYADEGHTVNCVTGAGFYPAEVWIWCLPSKYGQICAQFAIQYPSNIIQSTVTENVGIISVTLGSLEDGMSVCYTDCQWDWNWPFHQLIYIINDTPEWIEIVEHPSGETGFADCEPG